MRDNYKWLLIVLLVLAAGFGLTQLRAFTKVYDMAFSRYGFTYYDGAGRLERTLWGSNAEIPSWIPVPKDATMMGGSFHKAGLDPEHGQIEIKHRMTVQQLNDFYVKKFNDYGYSVETEETSSLNVPKVYLIKARDSVADRTVTITIYPGVMPIRAEIYFKIGTPAR